MNGARESILENAKGHVHKELNPFKRQYDIQNFYSSLKQWRMLHALIDCGSYAEAAELLHVSQSTLSYTLIKLQERLGVQLLKLEGRKAVLTAPGKLLVERSRRVLQEASDLEDFARNLEQ